MRQVLTRRAFIHSLALPLCAIGPKPSEAQQSEILHQASQHALAYTRELPDFLCIETIRRSDNIRGAGWRLKDVLGIQVGVSERREHYKLITLNGKPTTLPYRAVGGALSEGEWGSLLAEIFRPRAARFQWERAADLDGRPAYVFRYRVPPENASFHLEFGYRSGKPQSTVVGHKGQAWIDRETLQVVRLEQMAEIPRDFPLKTSRTIVEYAWAKIAGRTWLLPARASVIMGTREILTRNEVTFSDYQKFGADSTIVFEDPT